MSRGNKCRRKSPCVAALAPPRVGLSRLFSSTIPRVDTGNKIIGWSSEKKRSCCCAPKKSLLIFMCVRAKKNATTHPHAPFPCCEGSADAAQRLACHLRAPTSNLPIPPYLRARWSRDHKEGRRGMNEMRAFESRKCI